VLRPTDTVRSLTRHGRQAARFPPYTAVRGWGQRRGSGSIAWPRRKSAFPASTVRVNSS